MLSIKISAGEFYDPITNQFSYILKDQTLQLEHSLVSISKWEFKWEKPFLSEEQKTEEEFIDYVKCMTITQNVDPEVYKNIDTATRKQIEDYINKKATATTFSNSKPEGSAPTKKQRITSEQIYSWMIQLNIPTEYQKWHFNRLMTLIKILQLQNQPQKKMSKSELARKNKELNASRRAAMNTTG